MAEEFDILAVKVLAGEATPAEAARLEHLLRQDSALRVEFAELKEGRRTLKELGPLARALEAPPAEPPPERLRQWQAQLGGKSRGSESGVPAAGSLSIVKLKQPSRPIVLALAAVLI